MADDRRAEDDHHDLDDRERLLAEREGQATDRDDQADRREAHEADKAAEVNEILADAEARDNRADARDAAADRRDAGAALDAMVYGTDAERPFKSRRESAKDREAAREDRSAAHLDRRLLAASQPADLVRKDEDAGEEPGSTPLTEQLPTDRGDLSPLAALLHAYGGRTDLSKIRDSGAAYVTYPDDPQLQQRCRDIVEQWKAGTARD